MRLQLIFSHGFHTRFLASFVYLWEFIYWKSFERSFVSLLRWSLTWIDWIDCWKASCTLWVTWYLFWDMVTGTFQNIICVFVFANFAFCYVNVTCVRWPISSIDFGMRCKSIIQDIIPIVISCSILILCFCSTFCHG